MSDIWLAFSPHTQGGGVEFMHYVGGGIEDARYTSSSPWAGARAHLVTSQSTATQHRFIMGFREQQWIDFIIVAKAQDIISAGASLFRFYRMPTGGVWNFSHQQNPFTGGTFIGPHDQDYVVDFTGSTRQGVRFWFDFFDSTAFQCPISKIYAGNWVKPSKPVDDYRISVSHDYEHWSSANGTLHQLDTIRPKNQFQLTWRGLTDSEYDTLAIKAQHSERGGVFLYNSAGDTDVLNGEQLQHCEIVDLQYSKIYDDYNLVTATFLEYIG